MSKPNSKAKSAEAKARRAAEDAALRAIDHRAKGSAEMWERFAASGKQVREYWRHVRPRGEDFLLDPRFDD
jgi:hypothetical protein